MGNQRRNMTLLGLGWLGLGGFLLVDGWLADTPVEMGLGALGLALAMGNLAMMRRLRP